jgi:hypothetical protein
MDFKYWLYRLNSYKCKVMREAMDIIRIRTHMPRWASFLVLPTSGYYTFVSVPSNILGIWAVVFTSLIKGTQLICKYSDKMVVLSLVRFLCCNFIESFSHKMLMSYELSVMLALVPLLCCYFIDSFTHKMLMSYAMFCVGPLTVLLLHWKFHS